MNNEEWDRAMGVNRKIETFLIVLLLVAALCWIYLVLFPPIP